MKDYKDTYQHFNNLLEERMNQDIDAQIAEASRVVSTIDSIDSQKAYSRIVNRIRKCNTSTRFLNILTRIAAILFIPAMIAALWLYNQPKSSMSCQPFAMQEITSPPGVRSKIVLPDGSQVWLNAESTLKFKLPFDRLCRDVSLSGEAFFEVKKNPYAPFVVQSGKVQVKVLGTKFNCKAFEEERKIEVVLAEGKVSLNTEGVDDKNDKIMKPGDRAIFDKETNQTKIANEEIEKYIAWHDGKMVFDETPMQEVATQLARWYGIEVLIKDPFIMKYRITTTFDNESLHQVLELLRLSSPIDIQYIPAIADSKNQEKSRSKVIFTSKTKKSHRL